MNDPIKGRDFSGELKFSASRSSGPGGQNVNKLSTKIELRFNIFNSLLLNDDEKEIILIKLASKINKYGELILISQTERSQLANKEKVIEKFHRIISKALTIKKIRKPTKPSKVSREKRLETKKIKAEKKGLRRKIDL